MIKHHVGSMGYICQPIGSVFSGLVSEPIGRKRAMILVSSMTKSVNDVSYSLHG